MSKYADIEQIKKVIRDEWIKYIPMEFDMNIAFVLGKIAEVPTIEIVRCKNCKFRIGGYHNLDCRWDSGSIPEDSPLDDMFAEPLGKLDGLKVERKDNPTIEIVRCKDCKHYQPLDYSRPYDCSIGLPNVMPTDYCSYGERKDDE